jgi:DNA mismatch repair protein MutL
MISQVIKILPDSVANQIAAGEVVQRPSSVVKELLENSIDAFAKNVKVLIKDAGKTLIQVIDDGVGMSEIDARLAFERHATSKISDANDLFAISTFGFRGEALASIASVAQVELITKRENDEIGTCVEIHGSKLIKQTPTVCSTGTTVTVKNLFFNIPARRRFLKSDNLEFKHIVDEFLRVSLSHPEISFVLINNQTEIYNLTTSTLKQRIIHAFGKSISSELLDINVETSIINIHGFVGKPENAKKKNQFQYFFVNNRFIKHPLLYRVVLNAFENLLLPDTSPSFFIYFTCDPKFIDVNIHPTKTEIKFEDERAVAQILEAAIKQTLGKTSILPNIEFEQESSIHLPLIQKDKPIQPPKISINPDYNPFEKKPDIGWKNFFEPDNISLDKRRTTDATAFNIEFNKTHNIFQLNNRFLVLPFKSGLMIVDQHRAHVRIVYEMLIKRYEDKSVYSERLIFPEIINVDVRTLMYLDELIPYFNRLGFRLQKINDEQISVEEIPSFFTNCSIASVFESFFNSYSEIEKMPEKFEMIERFLIPMAKSLAIKNGQVLSNEEQQQLFDELFSTSNPQFTPDGKIIFYVIPISEIEKNF